jgi:hypothetical protein
MEVMHHPEASPVGRQVVQCFSRPTGDTADNSPLTELPVDCSQRFIQTALQYEIPLRNGDFAFSHENCPPFAEVVFLTAL